MLSLELREAQGQLTYISEEPIEVLEVGLELRKFIFIKELEQLFL